MFRENLKQASNKIAEAVQPQWKELWLRREPLLAAKKHDAPRTANWKELDIEGSRRDRRTARSLLGEDTLRHRGMIHVGNAGSVGFFSFLRPSMGGLDTSEVYEVDLLRVPFNEYPEGIQRVNIATARIALVAARNAEKVGLDLEALKHDESWLADRAFEGHLNWLEDQARSSQDTALRMNGIMQVPTVLLYASNPDQVFAGYIANERKEGFDAESRILKAKSKDQRATIRAEYIEKARKAYDSQDEYTKLMDVIFYTQALTYAQEHPLYRRRK
ncbi:MAG TPA: hypothetical protein VF189_01745 [Patescibacteria group bacterium]